MYKRDTKNRLAQLLLLLGQEECLIDQQRQELCSKEFFSPFAAFKSLDKERKGFISIQDLSDFLAQNSSLYEQPNCEMFLNQYDSDSDGRLSYVEFSRSFLPLGGNQLIEDAMQRIDKEINAEDVLPYDLENELLKVIEKSIIAAKKTETFKILLHKCTGFSGREAFEKICQTSNEELTLDDLSQFLNLCGVQFEEESLYYTLKNLDRDGDNRVTLSDFILGIQPLRLHIEKSFLKLNRSSFIDRSQSRFYAQNISDYSQLQGANQASRELLAEDLDRSLNCLMNGSRFEISRRGSISYQKHQSSNNFQDYIQENQKIILGDISKEQNSIKITLDKLNNERAGRSKAEKDRLEVKTQKGFSKYQNNSVLNHLRQLILILTEIISSEKSIEKLKQDLAICSDFNLQSGFALFDTTGSGKVDVNQFRKIMVCMGIFYSVQDISLFFSQFDKDNDGYMRFTDFVDWYLPRNQELSSIVNFRQFPKQKSKEIFSRQTQMKLKKLVEFQLQCCFLIEKMVQELHSEEEFSLLKLFQFIDSNDDGFITFQEIQKTIEQQGIKLRDEDIQILGERISGQKKSRVSFSEFMDHLTPKQCK